MRSMLSSAFLCCCATDIEMEINAKLDFAVKCAFSVHDNTIVPLVGVFEQICGS
jgi:hypothetical protein